MQQRTHARRPDAALALASLHHGGLDVQRVPAHGRPRQAHDDAHRGAAVDAVAGEGRLPDVVTQVRGIDRDGGALPRSQFLKAGRTGATNPKPASRVSIGMYHCTALRDKRVDKTIANRIQSEPLGTRRGWVIHQCPAWKQSLTSRRTER